MNRLPASLLLRPGRIGSLTLDHRIMMGSMHLGIEGEQSGLEQLKAFYVQRVLGGASLITTGGVAVSPEGGGDHMFCLTNEDHCEQLAEIVRAVHDSHGKMALQLFHSGRYAHSSETGLPSVAPSPVLSRFTKETPKELSLDGIRKIQEAFILGAEIAADAGFDAVEIMGSEGYLLNEFLSPLTNNRTDEYGKNLAGRMKLSLDIVAEMRNRLGSDYPIIFRMSGDDCMEGSTTHEETLQFAEHLEKFGVDALNIGIGWHESTLPTVANIVPEGAFAHVAAGIRKRVGVPVMAANRIHTPEVAEQLMARQYFDFIAPARPWLADPHFAKKIAEGDRQGMNICISCNQSCLDHTLGRPPLPVGCLVNPQTGHEEEWQQRQAQTGKQRKVAVVGGGVAGMEAARTAAECGHRVALYEAESDLGGQFRMASLIPGKQNFLETLRYYEEMLDRLGVQLQLNTTPDAGLLTDFDKVIVAAGVKPYISEQIDGIDLPLVCTYADLLQGRVPIGHNIAIIGAGGIGCDVAHYLAESTKLPLTVERFFEIHGGSANLPEERSITLISRSKRVAKGVGVTTRWVLKSELKRLGVKMIRGYECTSIEKNGVWIEGEDENSFVEADQVVICTGQKSENRLCESLKGKVDYETVGGAYDASGLNAARAIRQAHLAAMNIL